jgi:HK97 family phage portal protein
MAWYNPWKVEDEDELLARLEEFAQERAVVSEREERMEKLNPSQPSIGGYTEGSRDSTYPYIKGYQELEIVNRGVNRIVDDCAQIPTTVGEPTGGIKVVTGVKQAKVSRLLNIEPNLFQDVNTFRRNLITDYLLDGNIFIYFDGTHLYHQPANKVVITSSRSTYIEKYTLDDVDYAPNEIIHIKENSFDSLYRGVSRLKPARRTMSLMESMRTFQDNFFKNGAVPGLVIKSPNTLSEKIKMRLLASWTNRYRPESGGRRPLILDGGLEVDALTDMSFTDLDFQPAIASNEKIILKALGIPPVLLDSGNNANIRPNMRMYYLETILPIVRKLNYGLERFFGYELEEDITDIPGLQPELKDIADYNATLVNTGIISPNESRGNLGYDKDTDPESDKLRIPANIAGSAANPSEGGKPPKEPED